jgi:hypothetical protein
MHRIATLVLAAIALAGCTSSEVLVAHTVPLTKTALEIPENELLDVGITVFDPGVPEGEVDKDVQEHLIKEGTFVQIRRTESMYMAVVLRNTLQRTRSWGSVWITPQATTAADLSVAAKILNSDGNEFRLHVKAADATGRVWVDKDYGMETAAGAFNRTRYPELDPYQDVFNEVANDLATMRTKLSAEQRRDVRTVAALRYAADLSPEAFSGYVAEGRGGQYTINRLPAVDDPQFDRTQRVRQRERLFLETLDQHYDKFANDARTPYDSWREYSREESIEVHELQKSAHWRTGMGVATILASIVYGNNSGNNSFSDRVVRDAMMYMGMEILRTSATRREEKRLHTETLEELASSFEDQIKPVVVEVQGEQHRLVGTEEAQYQEWRDLLRRIFQSESGFVPEEVAIYNEPEVAPAVVAPLPTVEQAQHEGDEGAPPADAEPAPAEDAPAEATSPPAPAPPVAASNATASLVGGG